MSDKVIFVDDDKNLLWGMKRSMRKFNITLCNSPHEALKIIENDEFAVIVSDLMMPEMDGITFLEQTKIISPDSLRIMLTGHADLDIAMESVNKGRVFKFLTKPYSVEALSEYIEEALNQYKDKIELKEAYQKTLFDSMHDVLTGLPNRTLLNDRLVQGIKTCKRKKLKLAVVYIDLDKFKPVNDIYGHDVGDIVLKKSSEFIKNSLRDSDTVSRVGGDEFVVLISEIEKPEFFSIIAEKLLSIFDKDIIVSDEISCNLGCSIGISVYPDDSLFPEELISMADEAMYVSKKSGGSAFTFYRKSK